MSWQVNNGLSAADREKLNSLLSLKNNLTATAPPTVTDDSNKGYGEGSIWMYNGTTYKCTNATKENAVWVSSDDMHYFDSWATFIAAISAAGSTYVNKYAVVANANSGPVPGVTYTAPNAVSPYIVDGGAATYKVLAQGTNYSVVCQPRTVTNPVVTSAMITPANKPTIPGYYIFTVTPTDGLPPGIGLNDIAYFNGTNWSCWQTYSIATAVLVAGTTTNTQVTWRKFNGTWMSTADEYVPDGKEYQTGKLYNGKPVYRKCVNGTMASTQTVNANTGMTVPMTGKIIYIAGVCTRTDNAIITITGNGEAQILVGSSGTVVTWTNSTLYLSRPFMAWVEYTKS